MMKVAIETIIHEMEGRLNGYVSLLIYRYANLSESPALGTPVG